jgi:hypothetical protein
MKPKTRRRISATPFHAALALQLALGCAPEPQASPRAESCVLAVGVYLGLQRPVRVERESAQGADTLSVDYQGLDGENLPVEGSAICAFEPATNAVGALTRVEIGGTALPASEIAALNRALEREAR